MTVLQALGLLAALPGAYAFGHARGARYATQPHRLERLAQLNRVTAAQAARAEVETEIVKLQLATARRVAETPRAVTKSSLTN